MSSSISSIISVSAPYPSPNSGGGGGGRLGGERSGGQEEEDPSLGLEEEWEGGWKGAPILPHFSF